MTRGKAWKAEEELRLRELFEAGEPVSRIAVKLSMSEAAVYSKLKRLGLKDAERVKMPRSSLSSTGELEVPAELLTIEQAAKLHATALLGMVKPGVSKAELHRLKLVADTARKYKEFMADLVNYKKLESELVGLRKKVEELEKRTDVSAG